MNEAVETADLSLAEAADRLEVHHLTVEKYIRDGLLTARRVEGRWQITPAGLDLCRQRLEAETGQIVGLDGGYGPWARLVRASVARESAITNIRHDIQVANASGDEERTTHLQALLANATWLGPVWDDATARWAIEGLSPLAESAARFLAETPI